MAVFAVQVHITGSPNLYDALVAELNAIPNPIPGLPPELARLTAIRQPYPTAVAEIRMESSAAFALIGAISTAPYYGEILMSDTVGALHVMEIVAADRRNSIDLRSLNVSVSGVLDLRFQVV